MIVVTYTHTVPIPYLPASRVSSWKSAILACCWIFAWKMSEETAPEEKPSELTEEQKLALKFPGKKPVATDILRKRMQRGVKYFDSGDYAMAKSEKKGGPAAAINRGKPMPLPLGVGKAIPTPENIPHRKTSIPTDYHSRTRSGEYNLVLDH